MLDGAWQPVAKLREGKGKAGLSCVNWGRKGSTGLAEYCEHEVILSVARGVCFVVMSLIL